VATEAVALQFKTGKRLQLISDRRLSDAIFQDRRRMRVSQIAKQILDNRNIQTCPQPA